MKVLHAYNQHRGGGGANNATRATIELCRSRGLELEVFARDSNDVPSSLVGRMRTVVAALRGGESVEEFHRTLERFDPDIVHVHELFPLLSPWLLPRCTRRGVPVVMSCVDYRLTCPVVTHLKDGKICSRCVGGREYWAVLENCRGNLAESASMALYNIMVRKHRLFSDHVDHFIAPSAFTREWLIENAAIPEERITAIAPIVEIPEHASDPALGTYVAYAGRFASSKGIGTLAEASQRLGVPVRAARNRASLVSLDVPANIEVVVTDNRDELHDFYRGARMIVVPSLWFETFGLVGAEAMSHGIPVLASRLGALADLVEDGKEGLLFEPGHVGELAEKIERLWNDPELCRRLGRAARERAHRFWRPDRHYEALRAVYSGLTPSVPESEELAGRRGLVTPITS